MQTQDTQSQGAQKMRPIVLLKDDNRYCYGFEGSNKIKSFQTYEQVKKILPNIGSSEHLWYDVFGPEVRLGFQNIKNLKSLDSNSKIKTVKAHLREVNQEANIGYDEYVSSTPITPPSVSTEIVSQQPDPQTSFWDSLPDITSVGNVLSQISEKVSEFASSVQNSFSGFSLDSLNCCNSSTVDHRNELILQGRDNNAPMMR